MFDGFIHSPSSVEIREKYHLKRPVNRNIWIESQLIVTSDGKRETGAKTWAWIVGPINSPFTGHRIFLMDIPRADLRHRRFENSATSRRVRCISPNHGCRTKRTIDETKIPRMTFSCDNRSQLAACVYIYIYIYIARPFTLESS